MAGALLDSSVPVAVFVTPSGARAASAGTFIVAAGHVAAMSPGTNIGAAAPVTMDGDDLPETLKTKATQDAAAFLREIATNRGRNSEALERTVFEAASYNVEEALDLDIIDLSATGLSDLIAKVDGLTVTVRGIDRTLSTAGAAVEHVEADPVQGFLQMACESAARLHHARRGWHPHTDRDTQPRRLGSWHHRSGACLSSPSSAWVACP